MPESLDPAPMDPIGSSEEVTAQMPTLSGLFLEEMRRAMQRLDSQRNTTDGQVSDPNAGADNILKNETPDSVQEWVLSDHGTGYRKGYYPWFT